MELRQPADMPGRLVFKTVPDNSTVFTERLRITSDGKVGINQYTWSRKDHMFEVRQSTNDKEIARFSVDGGHGGVQGTG